MLIITSILFFQQFGSSNLGVESFLDKIFIKNNITFFLLSLVDDRFYIPCIFQVLFSIMAFFGLMIISDCACSIFFPSLNVLCPPCQEEMKDLENVLVILSLIKENSVFCIELQNILYLFIYFPHRVVTFENRISEEIWRHQMCAVCTGKQSWKTEYQYQSCRNPVCSQMKSR